MSRIERSEGRVLFGLDPANYDRARPGHPERVYEVLVERCGLAPEAAIVEVGPGTGQATRRLLQLGVGRLVAIEPNPELARYLRENVGAAVEIRSTTLEEAELEPGAFDLAVAASAFHWVDEPVGLARLFAALRPGGWCAIWWTLFGADSRDAFHDATAHLVESLDVSPTKGDAGRPRHGLDVERRTQAFAEAGFADIGHELAHWERTWDPAGIRALMATFSPVLRLDDEHRSRLLDAIEHVAATQFGGRVTRRLTTSLYTARKPS